MNDKKQTFKRANLAVDVVKEYVQRKAATGPITKSMIAIGKEIGYSNATVQRSLKELEDEGIVEILPRDSQSQPFTIKYKGEPIPNNIFTKVKDIIEQLNNDIKKIKSKVDDLELSLNHLEDTNRYFTEEIEASREFNMKIVSRAQIAPGITSILVKDDKVDK